MPDYLFNNLDAFKEFKNKNKENKKLMAEMKKLIADTLK